MRALASEDGGDEHPLAFQNDARADAPPPSWRRVHRYVEIVGYASATATVCGLFVYENGYILERQNPTALWEKGKPFNVTLQHSDGHVQVFMNGQNVFTEEVPAFAPGTIELGAGAVAKVSYTNPIISKLP